MEQIEKALREFSRQIPIVFTYRDRESTDLDWQLETKSE